MPGRLAAVPAVFALALALVWMTPGGVAAPALAPVTVASGVADDATGVNSQPKIARDTRGRHYLTFVMEAGGRSQIFLATSTIRAGGRRWELHQVTRGGGVARFPTLAVDRRTRVHLAWTHYPPDSAGRIEYARLEGQRWSAPVRLSEGTAYAGVPALVVGRGGEPEIVWYGIRPEAPTVQTRHESIYEILYSRAQRGRWTAPEVISPGVPDSINPTLATDAQGRLHSAWYQFDLRAYQARYTSRDGVWTPPEYVSTGTADAFAVAMTVAADGTAALVWERRERGGPRIYFAERGAGRAGWSVPRPLSEPGAPATQPTIARDGAGTLVVMWESAGRLVIRRRSAAWGAPMVFTDGGRSGAPIAAGGRTVDAMWTAVRGGTRELRFATLSGGAAPVQPRLTPAVVALLVIGLLAVLLRWLRRARAPRV